MQGGYHAGSAVAAAPDTCTGDHGIEQLVQSRGMVKKGEAKAAVENKHCVETVTLKLTTIDYNESRRLDISLPS